MIQPKDFLVKNSISNAKSLHGSIPPQLANQVITPGQRAYAFIDQWMRDQQDFPGWKTLSSEVAEQLHIFDAIENLEPEVLFEAASFEVVDQVLIRACVNNLAGSLQVAFDAGAKRILLPMASAVDLASVPPELFAKVLAIDRASYFYLQLFSIY